MDLRVASKVSISSKFSGYLIKAVVLSMVNKAYPLKRKEEMNSSHFLFPLNLVL